MSLSEKIVLYKNWGINIVNIFPLLKPKAREGDDKIEPWCFIFWNDYHFLKMILVTTKINYVKFF